MTMTHFTTKQLVDKLEMAAHAMGQLDGYLMQAARRLEALDRIAVAAQWCINDAAYKAPELWGDIGERWIYRLSEALQKLDDAS